MPLYHKYRPKLLHQIVGNKSTVEALQRELAKEDKTHAFLLSGPTGCGKTTLARIIRKELKCHKNEFHEVDSADFRGIDTVREIRKQSQMKSLYGTCVVWLIDECHKMTNDAQNAMLKTLEDANPDVYYILATTDPQKLIPTIRSRCLHFKVEPLTEKQMISLLYEISSGQGEELKSSIYELIHQNSQGHPRMAIQMLEQVMGVDVKEQEKICNQYAESQSQVIALCRALMQQSNWQKVENILKGLETEEPENVRRAVLGYCSKVLLNGGNVRAAIIMEEMIEPFYNTGMPGLIFACYSVLKGSH